MPAASLDDQVTSGLYQDRARRRGMMQPPPGAPPSDPLPGNEGPLPGGSPSPLPKVGGMFGGGPDIGGADKLYGGGSGGSGNGNMFGAPAGGGADQMFDRGTGGNINRPYMMGGVPSPESPGGPMASPTSTTGPTTQTQTGGQKYRIQPVNEQKFNDPNHKSAKYEFLRTASGFDPSKGITPEMLNALNALGYAKFSGSGDRLNYSDVTDTGRTAGFDPQGFNGDFIGNYTGQDPNDHSGATWQWDWRDTSTPQGGSPTFGGNNGNLPPGLAGPSGGGGSGGGGGLDSMIANLLAHEQAPSQFSDKIHQGISSAIDKYGQPVDENDPIIAAQNASFRGGTSRAVDDARRQMATRAASEGTSTGAFDSSIQSQIEGAGQSNAAYSANLMGSELNKRRDMLNQMLQVGSGRLSADEQANIQRELGGIDAKLRGMGIDVQNRDLDIRRDFGNRSLNQNDAHFYDQLGFNVGDREATMNQIIMQMLAGGK